jgi:preprotein translocase subunit SecE
MSTASSKKTKNPLVWLVRYVREAKEEMGKVTWPSQSETVKYSVLVIGISVLVAAFFGGLDWVLNLGLEQLISLVS